MYKKEKYTAERMVCQCDICKRNSYEVSTNPWWDNTEMNAWEKAELEHAGWAIIDHSYKRNAIKHICPLCVAELEKAFEKVGDENVKD